MGRSGAIRHADDRVVATRRARDGFLDGTDPLPNVRSDIATSWRRSALMGVVPDDVEVPYLPDLPTPHRLLDAAVPVIDRLASQLTDTSATILLANSDARIVQRWACRSFLPTLDRCNVAPGFSFAEHLVGTNGVGCALEEKRWFEVRGPEHFRECLQALVCVAAPIVMPTTNVVQGALNVTCTVEEATSLLRPLLMQAVADVERRMLEAASWHERLVLDAFLTRSRGSSNAVVALSSDIFMANPAAERVVSAADRMVLWCWAQDALRSRDRASRSIDVDGNQTLHVDAVRVGEADRPVAAVLEISRPPDGRVRPVRRAARHDAFAAAIDGRSVAARRMASGAAAAAADRGHVLVVGPDGAGCTRLARSIVTHAHPGEEPTVVTVPPADPNDVVRPNRAIVARRADRWEPAALAAVLDAADARGARVVVTAGSSVFEHPHLARFARRVSVPALAERVDDLPAIATRLLAELSGRSHPPAIRPHAMEALLRYGWPGNVSELRAVLADAFANAGTSDIAAYHLPETLTIQSATGRWTPIELAERDAILRALREHDGNKVAAAASLGLARSTLYRKLRSLQIDAA